MNQNEFKICKVNPPVDLADHKSLERFMIKVVLPIQQKIDERKKNEFQIISWTIGNE